MENKLVANIIPEKAFQEESVKMISAHFHLFSRMGNENGENDHTPILSADWLKNYNPLTEKI